MDNYHRLNSFEIEKNRYLFYDIFYKFNRLFILTSMYVDFKHSIDDAVITIENQKFKITDSIYNYSGSIDNKLWENCIVSIVELPSNLRKKQQLNITVMYHGSQKSYNLTKYKPKAKKFYLTAGTLFKHDYKYLKMWMSYYEKIGVQFFYLYYNGVASEKIKSIAKQFNNCILIDWDFPYWIHGKSETDQKPVKHHSAQSVQINHMLYKYENDTVWMSMMDLDEYFVLTEPTNQKLVDFLKQKEKFPSVIFPCVWAQVDTSEINKDTDVNYLLTNTIQQNQGHCLIPRRSKSIYQTSKTHMVNVHHSKIPKFTFRKGYEIKRKEGYMLHFYRFSKNRYIKGNYEDTDIVNKMLQKG